jgi:phasin family protein
MSQSAEQLSELHRRNLEAATRLVQLSMENSKRIVELQVETARALFEDSLRSARTLAETTDPQAQFAARAQFAQETAQRVADAMRRMGEISSAAQLEFTRTLGEQMSGASSEMMEAFQKMMAAGALPGAAAGPAGMQQAFEAGRKAFEEMTRVSAAAFAGVANLGKGK